ncbi:DUF2164 domain-containing protein [Alteromonadaceae bacterium M269]|nr:DUF2164 domain-containing protein [Alteromonadaceae bacterium M269]
MKLNQADKEQLILKLQSYCSRELDMELGQFDAEFLLDFIGENFGAHFYNQGLYDAQAALNVRIDSVSEAIAELEKPISN